MQPSPHFKYSFKIYWKKKKKVCFEREKRKEESFERERKKKYFKREKKIFLERLKKREREWKKRENEKKNWKREKKRKRKFWERKIMKKNVDFCGREHKFKKGIFDCTKLVALLIIDLKANSVVGDVLRCGVLYKRTMSF